MKRLKSLFALRCVSLMLLMCFALTAQDVLAKKDKDGKASASIVFAEKKHDFGNIREDGGPASYEFVFTNEGETPLVIISATASCGCTMPHYPKAPISPGKSGKIRVTYLPKGRPGEFDKSVKVRTNDPKNKKLTLRISGVVVP